MKTYKHLLCSLAAISALVSSSAQPMNLHDRAIAEYSAHPTRYNMAGGAAGILGALWLANRVMNSKIKAALMKNIADQRRRQEQLDALQARFENTPFENFRQAADEKISALVTRLDAHTAKKLAILNAEFERVSAERRRVEAELQRSRELLRQVELFMQSVRDQNGDAFLHKVIQTKQSIEDSYLRLQHTKNQLEQEMTSLSARANVQSREVARIEDHSGRLASDMHRLQSFVDAQNTLASRTREAQRRADTLQREAAQVQQRLASVPEVSRSLDSLRSETDRLHQRAAEVQRRIDAVRMPQVAQVCAPPTATATAPTAPTSNTSKTGSASAPVMEDPVAPNNNTVRPSAPVWPSNDFGEDPA